MYPYYLFNGQRFISPRDHIRYFFLSMIMPIDKIDSTGISSTIQVQNIIFKIIMQPNKKLINELKDQKFMKERQINFLQKEIFQISIEQQLQNIFVQNK